MTNGKRIFSRTKSISGILLIAVLLTATCPIFVYSAADNPNTNTLEGFPEVGKSSDTMQANYGTINSLYSGGIVVDNQGHISLSSGTVNENYGSIGTVQAGSVGTNYGEIETITNTGTLGVNDDSGTVGTLASGNVITRNDGTIRKNIGIISENYGIVGENYGTVTIHDGQITTNTAGGTVTFAAKDTGSEIIPAKGTVNENAGNVTIHSGNTITIKTNTGDIQIDNATVSVESNSGNITVGENATLTCDENKSSGIIRKTSESASVSLTINNGEFIDETLVKYSIVFVGDDAKAQIIESDYCISGVYYVVASGNVLFTLPEEYECEAANKIQWQGQDIWVYNFVPSEGATQCTITCRKLSACELHGHKFETYISNNDATCLSDGTKTAYCANGCGTSDTIKDTGSAKGHRYGEWVITKEATETETGTKERTCLVCGAKDNGVIPVIPHTHKGTLRKGTKATCTVAGVKNYYTCSCGKSFEEENCETEIINLGAWKAKGGKGYLAPTGHSFKHFTSNKDATCTLDGTKTAKCDNGCGAKYTVKDKGTAKGHSYGSWVIIKEPTDTDDGAKERTCMVCGVKDTASIPMLTHSHNATLKKGIGATCTVAGVRDYYFCSCGKSFEDAACKAEIANLDTWKAKGGKGYIAPTGHSFSNYISNKDATCTEDGTKTAKCDNGCGATDTVKDTGTAKGHNYGEWVTVKEPAETETGIKERTCADCDAVETEEIPVIASEENSTTSIESDEVIEENTSETSSDNPKEVSNQPTDLSKPVKPGTKVIIGIILCVGVLALAVLAAGIGKKKQRKL